MKAGTITAAGFAAPQIYVNGQLSTTLTANVWQFVVIADTTAENARNLDIGRTQDTNYLEGLIDEVRIYNRALGADEVQDLYRLGTRKFQPTQ